MATPSHNDNSDNGDNSDNSDNNDNALPPREPLAGPDSGPLPPFPLRIDGPVVTGFGRGSGELGIPTANLPLSGLTVGGHDDIASGVYFGWAGLAPTSPTAPADNDDASPLDTYTLCPPSLLTTLHHTARPPPAVHPVVLSIGWNPYYRNAVRSVEVHLLRHFPQPFYGRHLACLVLGFVRPERDYDSRDALVADIRTDIAVAARSLARPAYARFAQDDYLTTHHHEGGHPDGGVVETET